MRFVRVDANGRDYVDIAGDADTVDGFHASATPVANKLLAMNANAKFPTHTIEGSLTVETGLNVGTTGAGTGVGKFSGNVVVEGGTLTTGTGYSASAIDRLIFMGSASYNRIATAGYTVRYYAGRATGSYGQHEFYTSYAGGWDCQLTITRRGINRVLPRGNKVLDLGISGQAWDDVYADDFQNVADLYYMDSRKNRANEIVPVDDLAVIRNIRPSGKWDTRTGLSLIDDASLPDWIFTRDKETGETVYDPDGKPWLSQKMTTSLSWGAIRQLDGYRLDADAEREAIRARLDSIERRG